MNATYDHDAHFDCGNHDPSSCCACRPELDPPLVLGGQGRDETEIVDAAAAVSWVLVLFGVAFGMAVGAVVHGWWIA